VKADLSLWSNQSKEIEGQIRATRDLNFHKSNLGEVRRNVKREGMGKGKGARNRNKKKLGELK